MNRKCKKQNLKARPSIGMRKQTRLQRPRHRLTGTRTESFLLLVAHHDVDSRLAAIEGSEELVKGASVEWGLGTVDLNRVGGMVLLRLSIYNTCS